MRERVDDLLKSVNQEALKMDRARDARDLAIRQAAAAGASAYDIAPFALLTREAVRQIINRPLGETPERVHRARDHGAWAVRMLGELRRLIESAEREETT